MGGMLLKTGACQEGGSWRTWEKLTEEKQRLEAVLLLSRWKYFLRKSQLEASGASVVRKQGWLTWGMDDVLGEEK